MVCLQENTHNLKYVAVQTEEVEQAVAVELLRTQVGDDECARCDAGV